MRTIIIINGPNLNLLGIRKPEVYGILTLRALSQELIIYGKDKGYKVECFQSNHEGKIIDKLHSTLKKKKYIGCIINAGAFTHYSYAIRDAIEAITIPCIEVHLSDIEKREEFRKLSVITEVCKSQFKGMGIDGYKRALDLLLE
ncbi:MAG: type II 3-dehydroquinate dehydratase [Salinivirgaceae bacterium]|jgi:3-dehydroquinate dehydratase-2|nr:type II 3-dehydroquinate dehydratase [Salinivirgaceae bacterium]